MLLIIDIGNTNCLFALCKGKEIIHQWRLSTNPSRTADEYAHYIFSLVHIDNIDLKQIEECIISSVVPQSYFQINTFCNRYLKIKPLKVNYNKANLKINLKNKNELGEDRIANSIGALSLYEPPFMIIDSGTATTFDVINKNGEFEGGIIAPGINISMQALHKHAAKLPRIAIEKPSKIIGKNTEQAMKTGIYWGYIGLIKEIIKKSKKEIGYDFDVIATGGIATIFKNSIKEIKYYNRDLIIHGLLKYYYDTKNNEKKS